MRCGNVIDEFLDQDGLSHACAAEKTDLSAFGIGADQINNFDPRLKNFGGGFLFIKSRGRAMNRPALHIFGSWALVHRFSQQVKDAPQALVADGYRNRPTGIYSLCAAHKTVCCSHGNAARHIVANVLRHFHH